MQMHFLSFAKLATYVAAVTVTGFAVSAVVHPKANAVAVPTCPAKLSVTQSADPIAGWTVDRTKAATGRLEGVGFYDGPVAEEASLRPNGGQTRGQTTTNIHNFDGHMKPIYLACSYIGTDIVLSRPLPSNVKQCTITSNSMKPSAADDVVTCR